MDLLPYQALPLRRFYAFYLLVPSGCSLSFCADLCIGAMERGALPVCVRSSRADYLWDECALNASEWDRICRLRPPVCDLWNVKSLIAFTRHWTGWRNTNRVCTSLRPHTVAALVQIEYLWTDLEAVDRFLNTRSIKIQWIADEVDQRRRWAAGLRRAWLAAVVSAQ